MPPQPSGSLLGCIGMLCTVRGNRLEVGTVRKIATELALTCEAYHSSMQRAKRADGNEDAVHHWCAMATAHSKRADALVRETAPSGSGIDRGTTLDLDRSNDNTLVFICSFHHVNKHGSYDGWTEHTIKVRASLAFDFSITISGANRNDIKEHLHECYAQWLGAEYQQPTASGEVAS